ncbi:nudix hydrolase 24, chloroplastic-like [Dermochelys coriacea]|uniref:nudix hydrolase 24, chloroplastic-like n=1 Tax=Dermochelys coriacea TaxID=27794 RepID=UPI0018E860A3|nr:nudix hydrolase 24, chloroplastic-like [Dermochelys coriacea]
MAASAWSERVQELLKRMNNFHEHGSSRDQCLPFLVAGQRVGSVPALVAQRLQGYPAVFTVCPEPRRVKLHPQLASHEQRTAAMGQVLTELRDLGAFPCLCEWRDEHYEVMPRFCDPPLFSMERVATALLGVRCYGTHLNGYTWHGGCPCMWLGRRAPTKPTYPGRLDNLAAGGSAAGLGVMETLVKECQEEACIPPTLAAQARPVGTIRSASPCGQEGETYLQGAEPSSIGAAGGNQAGSNWAPLPHQLTPPTDLELPEDFEPHVGDGEMQEFYLWGLDEVKNAIASGDFKPNCALVALDFLIWHSHIQPHHEPNYAELVEGLHRTL